MPKDYQEIERIVEEFQSILEDQSIGNEPFQKTYEKLHFQPLLTNWLRQTLTAERTRHAEEKEEAYKHFVWCPQCGDALEQTKKVNTYSCFGCDKEYKVNIDVK